MTKKYRYSGNVEIYLNNYGMVKPNEVIESVVEINHPHFEEIKDEKKKHK